MRWNDPVYGETRVRRAFLFFPKKIQGETRWLEMASWVEWYSVIQEGWTHQEWVDEPKDTKESE